MVAMKVESMDDKSVVDLVELSEVMSVVSKVASKE